MRTLNYTQIFDETLKNKFKEMVQSGRATGGIALATLKEQLDNGDASELDWVVSKLSRLPAVGILSPLCASAEVPLRTECLLHQRQWSLSQVGDCSGGVGTSPSRKVGMYANDLSDQIGGMEKDLSELELPVETRQKNRGWPTVTLTRNTQAIVSLAAAKSRQARCRVIKAITEMEL